jgi:hypothetical protein
MGDNKVIKSYQTAEFGKFFELDGNTKFPPVSVVRWSYPDQSNAFPGNAGVQPVSSIEIYPKFSVLTHIANPEDISVSLSAGNLNVNLSDVENLVTQTNALVRTVNTSITATNTNLQTFNNQLTAQIFTLTQNTSTVNLKSYTQIATDLITSITLPACYVVEIYGNSFAGYDQYLQIVNDNNPLPVYTGKIKANENFVFNFTTGIRLSSVGAIRNSLTPLTFTQALADINLTIKYIV